ncbi:MAG: hypothetical protein KBC73_15110 [Burkholderiaceae bacterium]|nr:hypothetical protein [Burkholderiaceae bacterium]
MGGRRALSFANAALACAAALLGAAPFTPAIFGFLAHAPLAALLACRGKPLSSWIVIGAALLGWGLSPMDFGLSAGWATFWLSWVGLWCGVAAWRSRPSRR